MKSIPTLTFLLFLLSIPSAQAITIQQGVSFNTTGTNTTYIAGANFTVDSITVTRNLLNITNTSGDFIMSAVPSFGSLNVTILEFDNAHKKFSISGNNSGSIVFSIGSLSANSKIVFRKSSSYWNTFTSNSSGYISFTYSEGYSNVQFEALQDTTPPAVSLSLSSTSIYAGQSVTITCSASDNYQLSSTSLAITKPGNSQVSASCGQAFTDTSATGTYTITYSATDTSGNSASASQAFTVNSYGGGSGSIVAKNKTAANKTQANATVVSHPSKNKVNATIVEPEEPIKIKAQEKINEVKAKAVSSEVKAKISEAEAAFNKGDYSKAYDLAVEAEGLTRTVEARKEPEAQKPYTAYVIAIIVLVLAAYLLKGTVGKKLGK